MKIIDIKSLAIPDVKVVRFARFPDHRGYFTESFRRNDFNGVDFLKGIEFLQSNESYSKKNTVRGIHFQWDPPMGKLVRTLNGHMIDMVMDIRKGSPTFGKIIAYDMPASPEMEYGEWIWVPAGFAHGNYFKKPTQIEYYCTAQWNPNAEAGISPLSPDIDWSLCDKKLKKTFDGIIAQGALITDKDINGFSLKTWSDDPRSDHFTWKNPA